MDVDDAVAVRAHHLQNVAAPLGDLPRIGRESDKCGVDQAQNRVHVFTGLDSRSRVRVQPGRETDLAAIVADPVERVGEAPELVRRIAVRGARTRLQDECLASGQRAQPIGLPAGVLQVGRRRVRVDPLLITVGRGGWDAKTVYQATISARPAPIELENLRRESLKALIAQFGRVAICMLNIPRYAPGDSSMADLHNPLLTTIPAGSWIMTGGAAGR